MVLIRLPARYKFQESTVNWTNGRQKVGLFLGYGLGKTFISLSWVDIHKQFPVLILVPKSAITQWGEEIRKFTDFSCMLLEGTSKNRLKKIKEKRVDIVVANYDCVKNTNVWIALWSYGFKCVIADESTMLKSASTRRYGNLYRMVKNIDYRAILTGDPITEHADEIWAQAQFLADSSIFKSYHSFKVEFLDCIQTDSFFKYVLKPGAAEEIARRCKKHCIMIRKEEVEMQLPKKTYTEISLEMPLETRKKYEELKKHFCVELQGHEFDTQWALVKGEKLHEMCQGFMKLLNGTLLGLNDLKEQWLDDNIGSILAAGPTLIWTNFLVCTKSIALRLKKKGIKYGIFTGGSDPSVLKRFQEGEFDVLILTIQAAGAGLNLQRACNAVFYSQGYQHGMRENAEARCYREGSQIHKSVNYTDLIVENSMDRVIKMVHKDKKDMVESIILHLKSRF